MRISDLNTRITFYEYEENDGPEPGEKEKKELYKCWGKVQDVTMKDLERSRMNETKLDVTVTIREPWKRYRPTNKHYIEIHAPEFEDEHYNIVEVVPDLQNRQFVKIKAKLNDK